MNNNPVNANDPTGLAGEGLLKLIANGVKFLGRLGSKTTRELDAQIANNLIAENGGNLIAGGGGTKFGGLPQRLLKPQVPRPSVRRVFFISGAQNFSYF